jgi:hypothetical protein
MFAEQPYASIQTLLPALLGMHLLGCLGKFPEIGPGDAVVDPERVSEFLLLPYPFPT